MIHPKELFLRKGGEASEALIGLMEKMNLPYRGAFAKAAAFIHEAGWSTMSTLPPEERTCYQERLQELRPCLEELGVLRSFPDQKEKETRLQASEIVWPGASARQVVERLRPGIRAIIEGRVPNITKLTALAATCRKPVGNEEECLPDLVADVQRCVQDGHVLEGEMMRGVWERRRNDYGSLLRHVQFSVVTTDQVPPEALHGRPTGGSTLAAWWHVNPKPRSVAITSIAPYGYRFWCEASQHFPECSWELIAPVPEEPSVVGAIAEVGKIIFNLAQLMA